MRQPYIYPDPEEPYKEVAAAIALDDYHEERKKKMVDTSSLILKYRPMSFEEVLGNQLCIQKLAESVRSPSRLRTYLFTGAAGIGKTTLARIIGATLDATITELDAGTNRGVETIEQFVEMAKFTPIMGKSTSLWILDECHGLSQTAWKPLLKLTEEPPKWLYIAFCTTDPQKIPDTIKTRSHIVPLKPLKMQEIEQLVADVSELEGWKITNDVFNAICIAAAGSARRALAILQTGHSVQTRDELAEIVADVESENSPVIKLCQFLMKGGKDWAQVSKMLGQIDDYEAGVAHATNYLIASMGRASEKQAAFIWQLVMAISTGTTSWDKKVQLYTGIGKILWGMN